MRAKTALDRMLAPVAVDKKALILGMKEYAKIGNRYVEPEKRALEKYIRRRLTSRELTGWERRIHIAWEEWSEGDDFDVFCRVKVSIYLTYDNHIRLSTSVTVDCWEALDRWVQQVIHMMKSVSEVFRG